MQSQLLPPLTYRASAVAVDRELIPVNPVTGIKAAKKLIPKRKDLPALKVMEANRAQTPNDRKLITILMLFHGMRPGEVLALRRADVHDTDETITVGVRRTAWRGV